MPRNIAIETVPIGNPGNPADTRYVNSDHPNGVGAVAYPFRMGKTEITNSQYVAMLNAVAVSDPYGLYSTFMSSETQGGIVPQRLAGHLYVRCETLRIKRCVHVCQQACCVRELRRCDAVRELAAGRPTYRSGGTGHDRDGRVHDERRDYGRRAGRRHAQRGWRWCLPNEDEWYKAAYHKNDGVTSNYWNYPTGADIAPNNNPPSADTANSANYFNIGYTTGNSSYPLTDAGAYTLSGSPYGTFDQGGNVQEWNETLFNNSLIRGQRGGSGTTSHP